MLDPINKIYKIDNKLWVGSPEDNGNILCTPTRDISDLFDLPNSFVYEDDDSQYYSLDTVEKLMEVNVIAIGYTLIKITDFMSTTYYYVKTDSILSFIENKLKDCKDIKDYARIYRKYGKLLLAILDEEKKNG